MGALNVTITMFISCASFGIYVDVMFT